MNRLEELVWAWEEERIAPSELAELEVLMESKEAREFLAEVFILRSAVQELATQKSAARCLPALWSVAEKSRPRWALAACLVMVAAIVWLYFSPTQEATIVWAGNVGAVERNQELLRPGRVALYKRDEIRLARGSRAEIVFADGTHLSIEGPSSLVLQGSGTSKHVHFNDGVIVAQVVKQAVESPMLLTTPTAEVTVVGTTFVMKVGRSSTLVRMKEGAAKVRRIIDREMVTLYAGMQAVATASASDSFATMTSVRPLVQEDFEDGRLAARGWYDDTVLDLASGGRADESTQCLEFHFAKGATMPAAGGKSRIKFPETESVRLSYWVKYSPNWVGSGKPYGPNEFALMTNKNDEWGRVSYTRLTVFIEQNRGFPCVVVGDAENIDGSRIGEDLSTSTERRATAGGNGSSDEYGEGDYYRLKNELRNAKRHKAARSYFEDRPGRYDKTKWHHVEVRIRLNSIVNGRAIPDGLIQYRYNGEVAIDRPRVVLRTGVNSGMKFNQLILVPYMEEGSPADQTMWIDDLLLQEDDPQ